MHISSVYQYALFMCVACIWCKHHSGHFTYDLPSNMSLLELGRLIPHRPRSVRNHHRLHHCRVSKTFEHHMGRDLQDFSTSTGIFLPPKRETIRSLPHMGIKLKNIVWSSALSGNFLCFSFWSVWFCIGSILAMFVNFRMWIKVLVVVAKKRFPSWHIQVRGRFTRFKAGIISGNSQEWIKKTLLIMALGQTVSNHSSTGLGLPSWHG